MSYAVHVSGLSPETSEEKVKDFFLFCGAITSLTKEGNEAHIVFQKESAAKTSLMLNGGTLDGANLTVTPSSTTSSTPIASSSVETSLPAGADANTPIGAPAVGSGVEGEHHIGQEDKPKAGIMAEYLAAGYQVGDHIIQRAIDVDQKQGISSKFLTYVQKIDNKLGETVAKDPEAKASSILGAHASGAVGKAKEFDERKGISSLFLEYYSKALNTAAGQKVFQFYTTTTKQVKDVHEEAKRISTEKKAAAGGSSAEASAGVAPGVTEKVDVVAEKAAQA